MLRTSAVGVSLNAKLTTLLGTDNPSTAVLAFDDEDRACGGNPKGFMWRRGRRLAPAPPHTDADDEADGQGRGDGAAVPMRAIAGRAR
jgi:hypothetical protein